MKTRKLWKFTSILLVSLLIGGLSLLSAAAALADGEVDLTTTVKAPLHVEPGAEFTVNLSYSNEGSAASPEDTWVKATLPVGVIFVSAADKDGNPMPPDLVDGQTLQWNLGVLGAGSCCGHIFITEAVTADLPEDTLLENTSKIGSSAPESDTADNTATTTSEVCDMAGSTKQANLSQAKPADVITYTITIRMTQRHGEGAPGQREITLTDYLPPSNQARFLGWTSQEKGEFNGQTLHWQGQIQAGGQVRLQYQLGIEGDTPPGVLLTNRARLGWDSDEMDLEPVDVETYLTEDDHMFGPGGGQWQHAYGLTLDVPPNGVPETTRFQFRPLFDETPPTNLPTGWAFAHRAFELTAFQFGEIHRFNQPLTITIGYDDQDTPGLDQNTLRLWYRAGPGEPWAMLGEPVQHRIGQDIIFETDHFTEFVLLGEGAYKLHLPIVSKP